jgi:hypothetical protein
MPFTFLSHQAAVLPLKLARPRWFSGVALVLGSMAPDAQKFICGRGEDAFGHSIVGQFVWCLPLTLLGYWIVTRVVAGPLGRYLPDCGRFHLSDYAALERPPGSPFPWRVVTVSALVGSFSHVAWDLFTHEPAWPVWSVTVAGEPMSGVMFLQYASSVVGAALTVAMLHHLGRKRMILHWHGRAAPRGAPLSWSAAAGRWIGVALLVAASTAVAFLIAEPHLSWDHPTRWIRTFLRAPAVVFVALVAFSAWQSYRERRSGTGSRARAAGRAA